MTSTPLIAPPLPDGVARVRDAVREAAASGSRLAPRGAGTWWPDLEPDASRLDLSPIAHVSALAPADLVVTVGAGCRMDALGGRLAAAGVWLALGPPGSPARPAPSSTPLSPRHPIRTR